MPEGRIGVGGTGITSRAVELADVLGEVPAVCEPGAVFADGKGASGDGLGGIPRYEPERGVIAASEVDAGDLQVFPVNIALVECDAAVDGHFLVGAAALAVVRAFHHGVVITVGEGNRSIFGVVDGRPDTCFGLDECLVAIGIELRDECSGTVLADGGVLIECVGIVHGDIIAFCGLLPVADVVVGVLVVCAVDCGRGQLGAGIMSEGVVHDLAVAGGIASGGTAKDVVCILTLCHKCAATMVSHAGEQVAGCFVGLCKRHVIRLSELVQQVGTVEVLIAELLNRTAVGKAGAADTTVCTIARGDGMLHGAILAVGEAGGTTEAVALFGDEVCITIHYKAVALPLTVGVVCEITISGALFYI